MLIRSKIFLFLLLVLNSFPVLSQSIKEIEVRGNKHFDKAGIIEWSNLKRGSIYNPSYLDSAKMNIARNFAQRGYFHSEFEGSLADYSSDSAEVTIKLNISEGKPSVIRNVGTEYHDTSDILPPDNFSYIEGQIFNKLEIEENLNSWLKNLENKGYPFAKAFITSIQSGIDESGDPFTDINVLLDKGAFSRINQIAIEGNTSTSGNVIIRELRLNKDQIYSQNQIEEFPRRLNRLRFFEPVQVPEFYINKENQGVLVIKVKEKQTNNFDGIIGYIPATGQQTKGYFTGLVNVSMRNLFGTGRAAAIRWQQYDRFSQELELRYLEPWIFSYPFNISGGLFQRKQDTTFIQRRIEGLLEFLATEDISAGISFNSENVIPTLSSVPRFTVYNSTSITTGLNLKIDSRDDPYAPASGLLLFNSYSLSRKRIYGPKEFIFSFTKTSLSLQRLMIDFSIFLEIFNRQIIAAGVHGRELRGSFFEESDLFRLGGTNSLRGYRENQFLGSRIFWSNTEYRLLLTRRSFAFLFFDTGYYLRNEDPDRNIPRNEDFKTGYGAGLSIETGVGVLAVSYALAAGDNFSEGKIHFGIVNEF